MKKAILILLMFIGVTSYGQTQQNSYQQGYNLGRALAIDCENRELNSTLYSNTINGNFPQDYKNGVTEGWIANINACVGEKIKSPGTSNGGDLVFTGVYIPGFGWFTFFAPPVE